VISSKYFAWGPSISWEPGSQVPREYPTLPTTFPRIGEFGGIEQQGDGRDRFEVDGPYNIRYIEVEQVPGTTADIEKAATGMRENLRTDLTKIESGTPSIPLPTYQPPGKCNPDSDMPCSCPKRRFVDPPAQIPMPATRSNVDALEGWIKEYYKESAFNRCRRQEWPLTTGKPMTIQTKSDAVPYCCKKPPVVPLNFRVQVKADIEADVMKGYQLASWTIAMRIPGKKLKFTL
jgi:hypothetical protein